jgi:hypothetical protein
MDDAELLLEMHGLVVAAVEPFRSRGMKQAWYEAGRILGTTPRRVRAYLNGEVRRIDAGEYLRAKAAQTQILRQQEARLDHELASLRARLNALDPNAAPAPRNRRATDLAEDCLLCPEPR